MFRIKEIKPNFIGSGFALAQTTMKKHYRVYVDRYSSWNMFCERNSHLMYPTHTRGNLIWPIKHIEGNAIPHIK